ncbi:MAG: YihA family ribosome biogenesis GTP-binding protein, partial [Desulfosarcina sp.]
RLCLVDLPGYGYAKVPLSVKRTWGPMIETYLKERESLKAVVLIMDVRRMPGMEECNFIDWLTYYGRVPILVLTKTDKLSKTKLKQQAQVIGKTLNANPSALILFSAKTRTGRRTVWSAIEKAALDERQ